MEKVRSSGTCLDFHNGRDGKDRQVLETCWTAFSAYLVTFQANERPHLKQKMEGTWGMTPKVAL